MGTGWPTIKEIQASYPNKWEPLWTCMFLRPVSYPAAWLLIRLGFTANGVSLLSVFLSLTAGFMLAAGNTGWVLGGALLFNVFGILDCADGHIARVKGTASEYGGWMDALGGYVAYSSVLISAGIAADSMAGALAACSNLLMRLEYQHFRYLKGQGAAETVKNQKRIGANLGVTGFLMPLVLLGAVLNMLFWVVLFYGLFYTLACVVVSLRLIREVQMMQKEYIQKKAGTAE